MKNKCNTLFFKIIIVVLGAILCLAGALSVLNIKTSQDVFVENFVESQQKILLVSVLQIRERRPLSGIKEQEIRYIRPSSGNAAVQQI